MSQDDEIKLELFARSQAGAELAELQAENKRLRKALSKIKGSAGLPGLTGQDYINAIEFKLAECRAIAREALEVKG